MAGGLTNASVAARTAVPAHGWDDAVRAAAGVLIGSGAVDDRYPQRCVEIVREHGPYIVVAPGIALAHARPEDGVRRLGLAVAVLAEPVAFGHPANDPVDLVFAFASPDKDAHVTLLARLAHLLATGFDTRLRAAGSDGEAATLLEEVIR
jgi:PTS system ascorbate-specific IIA component